MLGRLADGITRALEDARAEADSLLFEPVVRLGVTGLSRAGKTIFITSLVANLLDRGRMPQLRAVRDGRLTAAFLQPQPDFAVPRFDYETHRAALSGPEPQWPASTRQVSQLRLSLRVRPAGWLTGLAGERTVHIDIVDYPGEWLLDLPLLSLDYAAWSERMLSAARTPGRAALAADWLAGLGDLDAAAPFEEETAQSVASAYRDYLEALRQAGFSGASPGRFLMPGDLAGSPAITFAPLDPPGRSRRGSLYAQFERRFEAYKRSVIRPFFRDHFARIDRQIVLVDALGALHAGPQAVADLREVLVEILGAFRPGPNSWLSTILGKRVERILFAATKADHIHHGQHSALTAVMAALVADARRRADFRGAATEAMAIASVRATVEAELRREGQALDVVRGRLLESGEEAAMHPGDLPKDPGSLVAAAEAGAERWLDGDYSVMRFAPPVLSLQPGDGPPHIRLDRAAEFLIGDRLA